MGQIEETTDHLHPVMKRQILLDRIFRVLIHGKNQQASDQEDPVFSLHPYYTSNRIGQRAWSIV
jgi:hypothetical protein